MWPRFLGNEMTNVEPRSVTEVYAEAQRYFMGEGNLNNALARLVAELKEHEIDYLVIGAVALMAHGYPRFTEDIDIVLTAEGLEKFRKELLGRGGWGVPIGYDSIPEDVKMVRSCPEGVVINLEMAGDYPGDGKPKPISFPDPSESSVEDKGVKFPRLEKLIELKLASGMTAPDRLKDLADVQELIKIRGLSDEFAGRLNPYVREKYLELLNAVKRGKEKNVFEEQS